MLSFEFSEDQELLRSSVREFCTRTIAPRIRDMIRERRIPKEVYDGLARMGGLLGMTVPQEYGGMGGADAVTTGIAAEEIARADPTCSIPVLFLVDNAWSYLVSKYGSSELRESILPDVARGKKIVGIASTEPNFGSDIASMRTTATLQDGMYVVNGGEKSFISLVRDVKEIGGGFVTVTKTSPDKGSRGGVTLLFIPYSDGMSVRYLEEMGGREAHHGGAP